MPEEIDYESIRKITEFLKTIIETKRILKDSINIVDINGILNFFSCKIEDKDSGIDSEPISNNKCPRFVPTNLVTEIIDQNDLDSILEHSLLQICKFLQTIESNLEENKSKITEILVFTIKFIKFLDESASSIPFREILRNFLEDILSRTILAHEKDSEFIFSLELLHQFGNLDTLLGDIFDIIIEHLLNFTIGIKEEEIYEEASFNYPTDFSRTNSLLFLLIMLRGGNNCDLSYKNIEDLVNISEILKERDDFFRYDCLFLNCLSNK